MASSGVGAPSRREASAVAVAFFLSSALGFALLALMARWLSPAQNASFLALWGVIFAFGSVLGAVEQEIARLAAHATLEGRKVPIGAVQTIVATSIGANLVLAVLVASAPGRTLTVHSAVVTLLTFVALSGFSVQILSRGIFLGRHAIGSYVTVLVGESIMRLAVAVVLVVQDVQPSVQWATLAVVVGCYSWLPVVTKLHSVIDWRSRLAPWRRVVSTVAALATANGLAALVLTGFPALATAVIGQVHELGDLFAVVTLSRVPLVLLAPVQAMAVPGVIRWIRTDQLGLLRRALLWIVSGSLVAAGLAAVVGYEVGPWATEVFMGDQYAPDGLTCALVLASTCVLAGGLLQAAVLVALERYWLLTACWLLAVAVATAVMLLLPTSAETRALWGFVSASVVAEVAIAVAVATGARRYLRSEHVTAGEGQG